MIWAGIRGDGRLVYRVLEGIQTSEIYINMLLNVSPEMEPRKSFMMQDGARIHTSSDAVDWLNFIWSDRWIGINSPRLQFSPYSMDLTPMDFSFWAYVKGKTATHFMNSTVTFWKVSKRCCAQSPEK